MPKPKPLGPSTGGTGIGWGGGPAAATGGALSSAGSTQPLAACAAAATAAAPHNAAAGAPPLMAESATHGLICVAGAGADGREVAATAPVELTNSELATNTPTTPLK